MHLSTGGTQAGYGDHLCGQWWWQQLCARCWSLEGWGELLPEGVEVAARAQFQSQVRLDGHLGCRWEWQWPESVSWAIRLLKFDWSQISKCFEDNGIHILYWGRKELQIWKAKKLQWALWCIITIGVTGVKPWMNDRWYIDG